MADDKKRVALFRIVEDVVRCEVVNMAGMPEQIHFPADDSTFGIEHDADEVVVEFDMSPIPPSKQQEEVESPVHADGKKTIITMAYAIRVVFARYGYTPEQAAQVPSSLPKIETRVKIRPDTPSAGSRLHLPHHATKKP